MRESRHSSMVGRLDCSPKRDRYNCGTTAATLWPLLVLLGLLGGARIGVLEIVGTATEGDLPSENQTRGGRGPV